MLLKFNETFQQFEQLNKVLKAFSTGINQFDDLRRLTANLSVNFLKLFDFYLFQKFYSNN